VIQYAAGYYGEPPAPIDGDVMDRIMASPRAKDIVEHPPLQPSLDELRRQHGTGANDDELILRALVPASDIDKMRRAGPLRRDYPTLSSPELEQARKLMAVAKTPYVRLRSEALDLTLRR
jgi:oxaloacetate decarboxylase alpha subunit